MLGTYTDFTSLPVAVLVYTVRLFNGIVFNAYMLHYHILRIVIIHNICAYLHSYLYNVVPTCIDYHDFVI